MCTSERVRNRRCVPTVSMRARDFILDPLLASRPVPQAPTPVACESMHSACQGVEVVVLAVQASVAAAVTTMVRGACVRVSVIASVQSTHPL